MALETLQDTVEHCKDGQSGMRIGTRMPCQLLNRRLRHQLFNWERVVLGDQAGCTNVYNQKAAIQLCLEAHLKLSKKSAANKNGMTKQICVLSNLLPK
jgi:hypothetical protein